MENFHKLSLEVACITYTLHKALGCCSLQRAGKYSPYTGSFHLSFSFFSFRVYLFIFRERGREGEIEGEKHRWVNHQLHPLQLSTGPATQVCALTGNRTGDLLLCETILNQLSHTGQGLKVNFL